LSAFPQLIEASDGGDDALFAATFFPAILDDLQRIFQAFFPAKRYAAKG